MASQCGGDARSAGRSQHVRALSKGLSVLTLFSTRRPALSVAEIATETRMPLPTVYRLVNTLESEGYLLRTGDGRLRPGPAVLRLGYSALQQIDIVEEATPFVASLAHRLRLTVNLAILHGHSILFVVRRRSSEFVSVQIEVGDTLPAVSTSIGKVLLAHLPEERLRALMTPRAFRDAGHNPVRSLDELRPQLEQIRRQGWAVQDEEVISGVRSIAAPVRDGEGHVVAGINVAVMGQEWPLERVIGELKEPLLEATSEVSRRLGMTSRVE